MCTFPRIKNWGRCQTCLVTTQSIATGLVGGDLANNFKLKHNYNRKLKASSDILKFTKRNRDMSSY